MIEEPIRLGEDVKNHVKVRIDTLAKHPTQESHNFVVSRFLRLAEALEQHPCTFRVSLVKCGKVFYEEYLRSMTGTRGITARSPPVSRILLAGLHYLCDPQDVIPDYSPREGFADDAFALNLCANRIKAIDKRCYRRIQRAFRR